MKKEDLSLENFLVMDSSLEKVLESNSMKFPFKISMGFDRLIDHIKKVAESDDNIKGSFARSILDEYKKSTGIHGAIKDYSVLQKHEMLIDNMMMFVFPNAFLEVQTYAASSPFMDGVFYASPKFKELVKITNGNIDGELNIDKASFNFGKIISGYAGILAKFYGINLTFDFPLVYKIIDPVTGLDRYYKMNLANEFMDVILKGKLKKLTERDIDKIKSNIYDLDYMNSILEPGNFEFTGFLVMNAINITDTEILSSIKKDLIEKDTITSLTGFLKLQHELKSLIRCPELLLGLADYPGSSEKLFKYGRKIGFSFLMDDKCVKELNSISGSIYDYSIEKRKVIIIDDLSKYPDRTKIEDEILNQGIKNILIAPLIMDDRIAGILELGSPNPGSINLVNTLKLREVLPLFSMAVDRSKDELNSRVRSVIKEKCTAIHPTLEWKFQAAALNYLKAESEGLKSEMDEIIFHDVYPLYGLSDIRNSSLQRNEAIRDDLIENLELAKNVIKSAIKFKNLHVFDELNYKIDKKIESLKFGMDSGDEAEILRFLHRKIVPLFGHIQSYDSEVEAAIDTYYSSLNENLMIVYERRKNYDESAMKINNMIASYLDEEQKVIQEIYPHYFERYKTDGVDHNIYIGSSLVEDEKFDNIYLRNIRLWQLLVMCGTVKKSEELKKDLSIPLETAHLILVQDSPLSIKFRYDEKRFDVDGAYNIRYEIMKKRIDKAEIKGKEERLTQPGKIAIVFSQNSEAHEYLEYIEYLHSRNYLKREVEELELEELQGISGLKALRVTVELGNENIGRKLDKLQITNLVSS